MAWDVLHFWILLRAQRYFLSLYVALNITGDFQLKSQFNQTFFTKKLIKEQSHDGSWHQLVDLNKKEGSLDATIFNCNIIFLPNFRLVPQGRRLGLEQLDHEKGQEVHSRPRRHLISPNDDQVQTCRVWPVLMAPSQLRPFVHLQELVPLLSDLY